MTRSLFLGLAMLSLSFTAAAETCTKDMLVPLVKAYRFADLNHDGSMTNQEAQAAYDSMLAVINLPGGKSGEIFKRFDFDGDNILAPGDLLKISNLRNGSSGNTCPFSYVVAFHRLDSNGDNNITNAEKWAVESMAYYNLIGNNRYYVLFDIDGNGSISYSGGPNEFKYYGYAMGDIGAAYRMHQLFGSP